MVAATVERSSNGLSKGEGHRGMKATLAFCEPADGPVAEVDSDPESGEIVHESDEKVVIERKRAENVSLNSSVAPAVSAHASIVDEPTRGIASRSNGDCARHGTEVEMQSPAKEARKEKSLRSPAKSGKRERHDYQNDEHMQKKKSRHENVSNGRERREAEADAGKSSAGRSKDDKGVRNGRDRQLAERHDNKSSRHLSKGYSGKYHDEIIDRHSRSPSKGSSAKHRHESIDRRVRDADGKHRRKRSSRERSASRSRRSRSPKSHRSSHRESSRHHTDRREHIDRHDKHRDERRGHKTAAGEAEDMQVDNEANQADEMTEIERRRQRIAAIKAKHNQAAAVVNPTATELESRQSDAAGDALSALHPTALGAAGNGVVAVAHDNSSATANGIQNDLLKTDDRSPPSDHSGDSDVDDKNDILNIFDGDAQALNDISEPAVDAHLDDEDDKVRLATLAARVNPGAAVAPKAPVDDMFADDDAADMFADEFDKSLDNAVQRVAQQKGLSDAYDDQEGYYNFQVGELLDGRYEIYACSGKGVFSTVLRARDRARRDEHGQNPEVAIKVIRSNETMYKAGQMEKKVLSMLAAHDEQNKRHCVRMLRDFEYRNHLCLVFEALDMNLREVTKKFGRDQGINIDAVALYAAQLMYALRLLRECNVIHADIKPDNILVSQNRRKVKLCDFGSAMFTNDIQITPYLVSRYYRPPEVILGLPYDCALDMWSTGCVIYELFTAKILFLGEDNNEMLRMMMDVKGPFPKKMVRKGAFHTEHFGDDVNMSFISCERDAVTKQKVKRIVANPQVKHSFKTLLEKVARKEGMTKKEDMVKVDQLASLLERMLDLNPANRITPDEALKHPFIKQRIDRLRQQSQPAH